MDLETYLEHSTQEELADLIRKDGGTMTQGAISQWLRRGVPAERVLQLERITQGQMTRYELRPDLYPKESAA